MDTTTDLLGEHANEITNASMPTPRRGPRRAQAADQFTHHTAPGR